MTNQRKNKWKDKDSLTYFIDRSSDYFRWLFYIASKMTGKVKGGQKMLNKEIGVREYG